MTGRVRCRSKRGGYREWNHATEFLATLAQHVPRPRQHVVTYAGHYANATGNLNPPPEEENEEPGEARPGATPTTKGKKWTWAKLIARVWQVDPLICDCGAQMKRGRKLKDEELRQFLLSVNKQCSARISDTCQALGLNSLVIRLWNGEPTLRFGTECRAPAWHREAKPRVEGSGCRDLCCAMPVERWAAVAFSGQTTASGPLATACGPGQRWRGPEAVRPASEEFPTPSGLCARRYSERPGGGVPDEPLFRM